jgi:hypothetical protein
VATLRNLIEKNKALMKSNEKAEKNTAVGSQSN